MFEFFLLDTLKTTFWIEKLFQKWTYLGRFFPKPEHFCQFSKKRSEELILLFCIEAIYIPIAAKRSTSNSKMKEQNLKCIFNFSRGCNKYVNLPCSATLLYVSPFMSYIRSCFLLLFLLSSFKCSSTRCALLTYLFLLMWNINWIVYC